MRNSPRILSGAPSLHSLCQWFEKCLQLSRTSIFADDAHVTAASSDIEELIQTKEELNNITDWIRDDKLSANPQKTEFMVI